MTVWNFWARYYDRLWVQHVSLAPTRALITAHIGDILSGNEGLAILDMGCGTGQQYGEIYSEFGPNRSQYLGVDLSPLMIARAVEKYPNVHFQIGDASTFQSDSNFDVIICSHSFPYYKNARETLAIMADLLNPGGTLLLSQACRNSLFDKIVLTGVGLTTGPANYRTVIEMQELGNNLFQTLKTTRISNRFFMPSLYLFRWQR
ncbi:trans-aconitate 2-methyltransferase [Desulfopila sp. IMCC35008]|uniref:class I SAM-dependent methyltransferase n=1 Tax=Desulfopila sp. IMCC35008 TaxID=2653858 RepID=UPI0013D796FD|nr:class I SAM-dependent methyltransferase [Desulfopila sp. IMCC35008]